MTTVVIILAGLILFGITVIGCLLGMIQHQLDVGNRQKEQILKKQNTEKNEKTTL